MVAMEREEDGIVGAFRGDHQRRLFGKSQRCGKDRYAVAAKYALNIDWARDRQAGQGFSNCGDKIARDPSSRPTGKFQDVPMASCKYEHEISSEYRDEN